MENEQNEELFIAKEQPREDTRLRGGSLIEPGLDCSG